MRTESHEWYAATFVFGLVIFGPLLTAMTLPQFGEPGAPAASGPSSAAREEGGSRVDLEVALTIVDDAQAEWRSRIGLGYRDADLLLYTEAATTACGSGRELTGTFYCPREERLYLDAGLYEELVRVFGAQGEHAHAYAIAHAMGHHAQRALGVAVSARSRAEVELQADCFAGIWSRASGVTTPDVARVAMAALATVNADRRQRTGREPLEDGASASTDDRVAAFTRGRDAGTLEACAPTSALTPEGPLDPRGSRR